MTHPRRLLCALLVAALALVAACSSGRPAPAAAGSTPRTGSNVAQRSSGAVGGATGTGAPGPGSSGAGTLGAGTTGSSTPGAGTSGSATGASSSTRPTKPAVTTPGGRWWGVDSSGPITTAALANVAGWYVGSPRPQMWGRYIVGHYALQRSELTLAAQHGIYVYLLVPDRNCSVCDGGGDVCGNDFTAAQASADAQNAVQAAHALRVPREAVLFKDLEQVSSCNGEPTSTYMIAWDKALTGSGYRTGFYGNSHRSSYAFPIAYCGAVRVAPSFARRIVLDATEPEPRLGAPQGTTGPRNAPTFAPEVPSCAPVGATKIWQYGESIDSDNDTDIDQADPAVPGLLAPDGSVT